MWSTGTTCISIFGLAQKLGLAQNILGPVEGQGICRTFCLMIRLSSCLLSNAHFVTSVGDQKPNEN